MDIISMTPSELKQIVGKRAEEDGLTSDAERKMSFWTSISICLAFIGLFIVGGIVTVGSLVKALSD
jgi:hypothetical protein